MKTWNVPEVAELEVALTAARGHGGGHGGNHGGQGGDRRPDPNPFEPEIPNVDPTPAS